MLLFIAPLGVCKGRLLADLIWRKTNCDCWGEEKGPFLKKTPSRSIIRDGATGRLTRCPRRSAGKPRGSVGWASCRSRSRPSAGRSAAAASPRSSTCRLAADWFGPLWSGWLRRPPGEPGEPLQREREMGGGLKIQCKISKNKLLNILIVRN